MRGHPRQVGVGQDDERVGAAELEHGLLDASPAAAPTAGPARSLPVMVTAPIRGSAISRCGDGRDVGLGDDQRGEQARRARRRR